MKSMPNHIPKSMEIPVAILTLVCTAIIFSVVGYFWSLAVDAPNAGDLGSNGVLVIIGAGQLITFCIQCFVFFRQERAMERQVSLMVEQGKVASTQTELMTRQTDLISKQATIAQQDYIATHRPILRVRGVLNTVQRVSPQSDLVVLAKITVTNIGSTNANVISRDARLFMLPPHGLTSSRWKPEFIDHKVTMLPGVPHEFTEFNAVCEIPLDLVDGTRVYVVGEIRYSDDRGTVRSTGFVRIFNQSSGGFFKISEGDIFSDYDYED